MTRFRWVLDALALVLAAAALSSRPDEVQIVVFSTIGWIGTLVLSRFLDSAASEVPLKLGAGGQALTGGLLLLDFVPVLVAALASGIAMSGFTIGVARLQRGRTRTEDIDD